MERQSLPLQTDFGMVRCALPTDAERIVQMVGTLASHHGDTPAITINDLARDVFGVNPWIYVLVAQAGKDLIGYAALCGLTRLQFGLRGMDMHHLFTEAAFRGRGVGQRLVEASKIKAISLSCSYLTVGTHPNNHRAQAFYAALGFERKDAHPPRFSMQLEP
ncbi:GNAT family N-acetyltransferase [Paracoccus sp. (in: a-proteobacteria)]|uniref:GNAT family N-acetyltransferase n=1 Tax=Paracoccus sp. TaxID=267 RepID=UPI0028AD4A94|nr:GNAT family N-acetyltransferase [Paracoccus sp. (in: a-proteobacteria)]